MAMRWKDIAIFSAAVLVIQMLLTKFVYANLGFTTQYLFGISPQTALGSQTFGDKILGFITGYIPFSLGNFSAWISMFIGVFLLVSVGMYVYGLRRWGDRNESQRIFAILLFGHLALFLVLVLMGGASIGAIGVNLLIGLAVNLALVTLAYVTLAKVQAFSFLKI